MARAQHDTTLEDFIQRRAAKDGDGACREVIVRLDEPFYIKLIDASRRYRQTPGALAGDYVRNGLADISGSLKALKGAPEEPDAELVLELAAERAKVRELEAAVSALKERPSANEDTIRHLIQERDGWKNTAEELRGRLSEVQDANGRLADVFEAKLKTRLDRIAELEQALREETALRVGAFERMKATEIERDQWRECESETQEALQAIGEEFGVDAGEPRIDGIRRILMRLQIDNDKLLTELASCARPLPPIITVTAKPERSPALNEALSQMATKAVAALREQANRGPEPYGLDRQAAEEKPSAPEAPLTSAFIKFCVGYHWAGLSVEQIAAILRCDGADVRRALKPTGRAA
ncbi:MAG: hypothetical protein ACRDBL_09180 [Rhabdaerophilum sp.]